MALWADDYKPAMDLLARILPVGLMNYLRQRKPALPPIAKPSLPLTVRLPETTSVSPVLPDMSHSDYYCPQTFIVVLLVSIKAQLSLKISKLNVTNLNRAAADSPFGNGFLWLMPLPCA